MGDISDVRRVRIEKWARRPVGHRVVPLLTEHYLGHFPELREYLVSTLSGPGESSDHPRLVVANKRFYELGLAPGSRAGGTPTGISIAALVPGREPLDDDQAETDLWAIVRWIVIKAREQRDRDDAQRGRTALPA
jgi:hypothetical protein